MYYILRYDYVAGIAQRREPFRAEHLSRLKEQHERGAVVMAGAAGDPPSHAVIVFRTEDPASVEAFARGDPYVLNGLVPSWRLDPWNVVIGGSP
jgi:uncharacterized protein YciI